VGPVLSEVFYHAEDDGREFMRRGCCQFAVYTARAPGKASANEDCAGWIRLPDDRWVFLVADGLGGLPAGASASRLAVVTIVEHLNGLRQDDDLRAALLEGIDHANEAILSRGSGGATTLVAAEISARGVRPYHIGDSTILVTGQRGAIKYQSVSHSPTGYLEEAGMLDEAGAMMHAERHVVSNVLGSNEMRLEIGPRLPLARYDTVLLASDALRDNLNLDQVINHVRCGALEKSLTALAADCQQQMLDPGDGEPGHPDDLTMISIRRNAPEPPVFPRVDRQA
jgi:serine/threonine protein phosphatase PrpC